MNSRVLAEKLPDIPRWVESRAVLLEERGEVFGLRELPELSFAVRNPETGTVTVIGIPAPEAIRAAVHEGSGGQEVVAPREHGEYIARVVPEWTASPAIIHRFEGKRGLPPVPPGSVCLLGEAELDLLSHIPEPLRRELATGAKHSPVAAALADGKPVSFCYANGITESLWDVSIDTIAEYRGQGYATLCAAYMIRYMRDRGKQPVWGAVAQNTASLRLAAKLGFVPVDRMLLLERPDEMAL